MLRQAFCGVWLDSARSSSEPSKQTSLRGQPPHSRCSRANFFSYCKAGIHSKMHSVEPPAEAASSDLENAVFSAVVSSPSFGGGGGVSAFLRSKHSLLDHVPVRPFLFHTMNFSTNPPMMSVTHRLPAHKPDICMGTQRPAASSYVQRSLCARRLHTFFTQSQILFSFGYFSG